MPKRTLHHEGMRAQDGVCLAAFARDEEHDDCSARPAAPHSHPRRNDGVVTAIPTGLRLEGPQAGAGPRPAPPPGPRDRLPDLRRGRYGLRDVAVLRRPVPGRGDGELDALRDSRHRRGRLPGLPVRSPARNQIVPHVDRLPVRGGPAPAARAARPDRHPRLPAGVAARATAPGTSSSSTCATTRSTRSRRGRRATLVLHARRGEPRRAHRACRPGRVRDLRARQPRAALADARISAAATRSARRGSSRWTSLSMDFVLTTLGVALGDVLGHEPVADPDRARARSWSCTARSACRCSQGEARIDPKTGLFNARYFATALVRRDRHVPTGSAARCR